MPLPLYALSLPRPMAWAVAAGIASPPPIEWEVILGHTTLPWHEEHEEGWLQTPAWLLIHNSEGPGSQDWHKNLAMRAAERGKIAPRNHPKGCFTGCARLDSIEPFISWPGHSEIPKGTFNWHMAYSAKLHLSDFHVVKDKALYVFEDHGKLKSEEPRSVRDADLYVYRDTRFPAIWCPTEKQADAVWRACFESRA